MMSNNLIAAEFKTRVIKTFGELKGSGDEFGENFNKEMKNKNGHENYKRDSGRNEEHVIGDEEYVRWNQQWLKKISMSRGYPKENKTLRTYLKK